MTKQEQAFIKTVWDFWRTQGRHSLPWRQSKNPYQILVSEIMLQQTQVDRVIPKYQEFLKMFPTVKVLAAATLGDVLRAWQGLGYNRRARMLHECAQVVMREHGGTFPNTYEGLKGLPGVGPYTAGAVMAFAYNQAVPIIETNIRTVYLHHFFKTKQQVSDTELLEFVEKTLDQRKVREWYAALMDYGSHLKKTHGNPNARSRAYTKQSKFVGSDRQIRGAIIKTLAKAPMSSPVLEKVLHSFEAERVKQQLTALLEEGMVTKTGRKYHLP